MSKLFARANHDRDRSAAVQIITVTAHARSSNQTEQPHEYRTENLIGSSGDNFGHTDIYSLFSDFNDWTSRLSIQPIFADSASKHVLINFLSSIMVF